MLGGEVDMKLSKTGLVGGAVVVVVLLLVGVYLVGASKDEEVVVDDFPVWVLADGKTALYREMKISGTRVEKTITVTSLEGELPDEVKIT